MSRIGRFVFDDVGLIEARLAIDELEPRESRLLLPPPRELLDEGLIESRLVFEDFGLSKPRFVSAVFELNDLRFPLGDFELITS